MCQKEFQGQVPGHMGKRADSQGNPNTFSSAEGGAEKFAYRSGGSLCHLFDKKCGKLSAHWQKGSVSPGKEDFRGGGLKREMSED